MLNVDSRFGNIDFNGGNLSSDGGAILLLEYLNRIGLKDHLSQISFYEDRESPACANHDRMDILKVPALTEKDYSVRGSTALLDALGSFIHHIARAHKHTRKEGVLAHTVLRMPAVSTHTLM